MYNTSMSKKQKQIEVQRIKEAITCLICKESIFEVIRQCTNGHVYCRTCLAKITKCGYCNTSIDYINSSRNLVLEQLRDEIEILCENKNCTEAVTTRHIYECKYNYCTNMGCEYHGTKEELINHDLICGYGKTPCPIVGCEKSIVRQEVTNHIEIDHKNICKEIEPLESNISKKEIQLTKPYYFKHDNDYLTIYVSIKQYRREACIKYCLTKYYNIEVVFKYGEEIRGRALVVPYVGNKEIVLLDTRLGITMEIKIEQR
jgi:hypothetical protein